MKNLIAVAFYFACAVALSAERHETSDFQEIARKTEELGEIFGNENVLVALDIDNTLLTMNQDLGSEAWYRWQATNIGNPNFTDRVAEDEVGLLEAMGMIFSLAKMHPPQPDLPQVVSKLQEEGFPTIVLTARGTEDRDATRRELKRNGFNFHDSAIGPHNGFAGSYLPYNSEHPEESGLSSSDLRRLKLGVPIPVRYEAGVFLADGQHKGAMLRTLLHKTGRRMRAVVFVDNDARHCERVQQAFADQGLEVVTFRYSREDENSKRFHEGDKTAVTTSWRKLHSSLKEVFR